MEKKINVKLNLYKKNLIKKLSGYGINLISSWKRNLKWKKILTISSLPFNFFAHDFSFLSIKINERISSPRKFRSLDQVYTFNQLWWEQWMDFVSKKKKKERWSRHFCLQDCSRRTACWFPARCATSSLSARNQNGNTAASTRHGTRPPTQRTSGARTSSGQGNYSDPLSSLLQTDPDIIHI